MWQIWKSGIPLCFAALAALALMGCGGGGAGGGGGGVTACGATGAGATPITLDGTWDGCFLQGGVPPALVDTRFAHAPSGSISAALTDNGDGTVLGTITMTPDICAEFEPEISTTVEEPVTGTLTATTLTFSYDTSTTLSSGLTVTFTAPFPADPILGDYDGTTCDAAWAGGIRLVKQ